MQDRTRVLNRLVGLLALLAVVAIAANLRPPASASPLALPSAVAVPDAPPASPEPAPAWTDVRWARLPLPRRHDDGGWLGGVAGVDGMIVVVGEECVPPTDNPSVDPRIGERPVPGCLHRPGMWQRMGDAWANVPIAADDRSDVLDIWHGTTTLAKGDRCCGETNPWIARPGADGAWAFTDAPQRTVLDAAGRDDAVVIVAMDHASPTIWSAGPTAWQRHDLGEDAEPVTVAEGSDGLLVGGHTGRGRDRWRPTVWASPDGASWTAIDLPVPRRSDAEVQELVRVGDGFLARGIVGLHRDRLSRLDEPESHEGWFDEAWWVSLDGHEWRTLDLKAVGWLPATDLIASTPDGAFTIGSQDGTERLLATVDGVAWRDVGPAIGDDVYVQDIEVVGDAIVAVGDVDGEPGIWLGTQP